MLGCKALRKKGGIIIKKVIFFLILFFSFIICPKAEIAHFYEAEYIDNVYLDRQLYSNNAIYYQQARIYRHQSTNEFVYCLQPFEGLDKYATYESYINPDILSEEQIDRITKLAYFGYGYGNHTDKKWFAVTQVLIWQTADYQGTYYFTDSLNGNKTDKYQPYIDELNHLVELHTTLPSFAEKTYHLIEKSTIVLEDTNNVLNHYSIETNYTSFDNNKLIISGLKEGQYLFTLTRKEEVYNRPPIFYLSNTSQNLFLTGDLERVEANIKLIVEKSSIEINKIDKDNNTTTPQGEASLDGAVFGLYNDKDELLQEVIIKDNKALIQNMNYGTYYLLEEKSGEGYLINNNKIEVQITPNNPNIVVNIPNEVIKRKYIIHKDYGKDDNSLSPESNISFEIRNNQDELINTITTNDQGNAEVLLPYGTYQLIQINTTKGYNKVDNSILEVKEKGTEKIYLKDIEIPIPNTLVKEETTTNNNILLLILILLILNI